MSRRGNQIRGPQSALTDFLAQHNISARQIRLEYEARQRAANAEVEQPLPGPATDGISAGPSSSHADEIPGAANGEAEAQGAREPSGRQKKQKKPPKKRRRLIDDSDNFDDEELPASLSPAKRAPGQIDNCANCSARFTVTPYSRAAPPELREAGSLLCSKCANIVLGERPKKQGNIARERRRQVQSNLLDGNKQYGAKSLLQLCIEKVAKHIDQIDDFGDMAPTVLDKLSRILSKNRAIDSRILPLFLKPDLSVVSIYDCSKLETDDFQKILAIVPTVESLTLLNASQFKDDVMEYLILRVKALKHLHLHSANLISEGLWQSFFTANGKYLDSIRLEFLDQSFDSETIKVMVHQCPKLNSLRLEYLVHLKDDAISGLARFSQLEHLTLRLGPDNKPSILVKLLKALGKNLRTLALKDCANLDQSVLTAIRMHCHHIQYLKLTGIGNLDFNSFYGLFAGWKNSALVKADFSSVRTLEDSIGNVALDEEGKVEPVKNDGFKALMAHSGSRLEKLDVHSCRHISHEALSYVFAEGKIYPKLEKLDLSFIPVIDDYLVDRIVRCCPSLEFLTIYGCPRVYQDTISRVALRGRYFVKDD